MRRDAGQLRRCWTTRLPDSPARKPASPSLCCPARCAATRDGSALPLCPEFQPASTDVRLYLRRLGTAVAPGTFSSNRTPHPAFAAIPPAATCAAYFMEPWRGRLEGTAADRIGVTTSTTRVSPRDGGANPAIVDQKISRLPGEAGRGQIWDTCAREHEPQHRASAGDSQAREVEPGLGTSAALLAAPPPPRTRLPARRHR